MAVPPPLHVLVVEDDPDARANLCDILELDGYRVETAGTVAEALDRENWSVITTVILDYRLPDGSAQDLLPRLRELAPKAAIIVSTGVAGLDGAILALQHGAVDYILKPVNADALRASLMRIAERQKLAWAKERTETAFRTLVEAAPSMIVILRLDQKILYLSSFAEQMTGYKAREVVGKDYFEVFVKDPGLREAFSQKLNCLVADAPLHGFDNPVVCKDGTRRWIVWNAQLLADYDDGPAILAIGQDITSLKQAQEQALQSERLAAIGQMMTGLAHESGNALARSQACLEMLAFECEDRPKALNLITRIQAAQDHLKQLYDEVRNYAAPVKLQLEPWNLALIWRQAWDNLHHLRQGKTADLREETSGLDLRCLVDQFRLGQVFRNILENSLAACQEDVEIQVLASRADLEGHPAMEIAFRDNGPGLNAEQRQRVFDPFFTTKTKGTGLGMAIAKRIVEAHGGRITVGSGLHRGAEILITLPYKKP
ncbi:MAG: PAS domain S-box protein [Planctomycetes bacterium]|nr:PAS domain S-box protein [Planctomycetota bacterium]